VGRIWMCNLPTDQLCHYHITTIVSSPPMQPPHTPAGCSMSRLVHRCAWSRMDLSIILHAQALPVFNFDTAAQSYQLLAKECRRRV